MLQKIINAIFNKTLKVGVDVARNRLINKHTPKGIALLLSGGFIFGYLNEQQVNFIVTLLSGLNITWTDMYLVIINLFVIFLIIMGGWLILAKVQDTTKRIRESKQGDK